MSKREKVGIMERRRALETARNILYSKVGKVVLEENKFPDRTLQLKTKLIDVESKKNSSLIDNDKKMFKRSRLIYNLEPTILMERPASPLKQSDGNGQEGQPNYMAAIRKVPVYVSKDMPPTIDAFTALKRKTKNIWQTKYTEEDMSRKFRSILMQSPPLTDGEQTQLDKGYEVYRPPSRNEEEAARRIEEKRREKIALLREVERSDSPDAQMVFITQLEREAQASRGSKSYLSRSGTGRTSGNANSELHFNPFHLERFEKMRAKQKRKYYNKIKL